MEDESYQIIFDVAEYIYNFSPEGKIPVNRLYNYLKDKGDIDLDELFNEARSRVRTHKVNEKVFLMFPIEYIRDVLLLAIFIGRRKMPIDRIKYVTRKSYEDKFNFEGCTEEIASEGMDTISHTVPLIGSRDGTTLYSGIAFSSKSLPFKNALSCIYIGSKIIFGYEKDELGILSLRYLNVAYTGITGFDIDFPEDGNYYSDGGDM